MSQNTLNTEQLLLRVSELESEIKILKQKRKYGLVWEDKAENVVDECNTKYPILIQDKKRSIKDKESGKPTNILIEGDNYHALQVLNYTHKGKIDVIYIDPPYNTGNKDFIYNDNYVDREDGFRHSKWLSFMSKRLHLAKELLKDSGVIFISIDENEFAQLKLLSDSIFGLNNFVECMVWNKKSSAKGVPPKTMIVGVHEYILVYKVSEKFTFLGVKRSGDTFSNPDLDPRGPWRNTNIKSTVNKIIFTITDPETGNEYLNTWAYSKETLDRMILEKQIIFPKNKNGLVRAKEYLYEFKNENTPILSNLGLYDAQVNTELLNNIFQKEKAFSNPKPLNLIKYLISVTSENDISVLDFMAGSGTTGHAVMELNKEDGGNRQFILVTNNGDEKSEHKICEQITYERLRRVMTGYTNKKGEQVEGLGGNLEYLKCDFVEKTRHTDNMKMRIMRACTEMLCLKEGAFKLEKEVKDGDILMYRIYSGYRNKLEYGERVNDVNITGHSVGIYYDLDDSYLDDMRADLKSVEGTRSAYIFSLSNETDFIDDYRKWKGVDIEEIPQKILEIYEQIHKANTRKRK